MHSRSEASSRVGGDRVLRLPRGFRDRIAAEARAGYPLETCGILIGVWDASGAAVVRELRAAENVAQGDRRRRFSIDPRTLLQAQRDARAADLEVIGYYHSHPDSPAVPSRVDLEAAWPGVSYLIASLVGGDLDELRGWRLDTASGRFVEERVELPATAPAPRT